MIVWIILLILLAGLSVVVLGVGILLTSGMLQLASQATERATATIVGNEVSEDSEGQYFTPVARFTVASQNYYVRGGLAAGGRPDHKIGQRLTVYYPPGQPDKALLYRYEGWWIALLPVLVGGGFLLGVINEVVKLFR
jgi:hypothetical protein